MWRSLSASRRAGPAAIRECRSIGQPRSHKVRIHREWPENTSVRADRNFRSLAQSDLLGRGSPYDGRDGDEKTEREHGMASLSAQSACSLVDGRSRGVRGRHPDANCSIRPQT